jgi:hypothetical protein
MFATFDVRSHLAPHSQGKLPLTRRATFFDYTIIQGSRYRASRRSATPRNSYIQVAVDDAGRTSVGELTDIISIELPSSNSADPHVLTFGLVQWLVPLNMDTHLTVWEKL